MTRRFALALIGGLASAAARLAGAAGPRVRVLILDGYSNHDWRLTTALIRGMLEPTGVFTVDVATAPPTADAPGWDTWRPAFASYDVIPAGEGPDTGHGARVDTVVHRLGDHPIHAGLPRAWLTPDIEVYHYARGPAQRLEVLSYGFDPKTEMRWPLEWTTTFGRGRVYTSTFGHVWKGDTQPSRMRCAGLQTVVVRALQWLAGRDVTWPVPPDFPTADRMSVRPEIVLPG